MVKIFELKQQLTDLSNYNSAIVDFWSFQEYLQSLYLVFSNKDDIETYEKYIDYEERTVTFMFEKQINHKWVEFTHFARVVD